MIEDADYMVEVFEDNRPTDPPTYIDLFNLFPSLSIQVSDLLEALAQSIEYDDDPVLGDISIVAVIRTAGFLVKLIEERETATPEEDAERIDILEGRIAELERAAKKTKGGELVKKPKPK